MNLSDLTRMQSEHHLFISLITNSQKCVWHHNALQCCDRKQKNLVGRPSEKRKVNVKGEGLE